MARIRKILKWTAISITGLLSLVILTSIILAVFEIRINLNRFRPTVERVVSDALDRNVRITGPVSLTTSLRPTLEIHGVRIDHPDGWDNDTAFASMEMARIQIGLTALWNKQIDIGEFTAKTIALHLHTNEQGDNNWQFTAAIDDTTESTTSKTRTPSEAENSYLQALDTLSLQNIEIYYRDDSVDKTIHFRLDELVGTAAQDQPLKLNGNGHFQGKPYSFLIDADALNKLRLRQQLYSLSISGEVAGSPYTAKGVLGREAGESRLNLDSTLSNVDIGALLEWLNLTEGINARTDELALHLQLHGNNLGQLLSQSNAAFALKGGRWTLTGAGDGPGVRIEIKQGTVNALAGTPVSIQLSSRVDERPVTILIQGTELINYFQNPEQLPVTIRAETEGTTLDFQGNLKVPISKKDVSLSLRLEGEKLDSLNDLFHVDLPPIGPYSLAAQFAMSPEVYDLSDLRIHIGDSDLNGNLTIRVDDDKPQFQAHLSSSLLQIDDFAPGQWNLEGKSHSETPVQTDANSEQTKSKEQNLQQAYALLSPDSLNRANAHVSLSLDNVISGQDRLGKGTLQVGLENGRFSVEPLELELADGTARMEFSYYPTEDHAEIHLTANVEGLDVGIPIRRVKPDAQMGGRLNLDILLDSITPALGQLLANGSGHFDLAFSPTNFNAGVIDLWAINVLSALTSKVDSEPTSTINCLVASFQMDDGIMQDRIIFMDTTRMMIEGTAVIDFKQRKLRIQAKPTAKRPEFFSIAVPIQIRGKFEDFGLKIKTGHLITTIGSFLTSPVHVPLRRLFGGKIPPDGVDACRIAWEKRNPQQ